MTIWVKEKKKKNNDIVHGIAYDIGSKVKGKFNSWIVKWFYIWRNWLQYEIEDENSAWLEYPEDVSGYRKIWINVNKNE